MSSNPYSSLTQAKGQTAITSIVKHYLYGNYILIIVVKQTALTLHSCCCPVEGPGVLFMGGICT